MAIRPEARGWFERGVFDLAIARAHLQSKIWDEGAKLARHAALKFLQAAVVARGEPNPSPRVPDLLKAIAEQGTDLQTREGWSTLDQAVGDVSISEEAAKRFYGFAEQIRDAVGTVLER